MKWHLSSCYMLSYMLQALKTPDERKNPKPNGPRKRSAKDGAKGLHFFFAKVGNFLEQAFLITACSVLPAFRLFLCCV